MSFFSFVFGTFPAAIYFVYWSYHDATFPITMVSLRRRHISHTVVVSMFRFHQAINPFIYGFDNVQMCNEASKIGCIKFMLKMFKCFKKTPRNDQLVTICGDDTEICTGEIVNLMDNNGEIEPIDHSLHIVST